MRPRRIGGRGGLIMRLQAKRKKHLELARTIEAFLGIDSSEYKNFDDIDEYSLEEVAVTMRGLNWSRIS
jgi:hypothetical protein